MNRALSFELAKILAPGLNTFIDRFAGAVQVAEKQVLSETGSKVEKFPIADLYVSGADCGITGGNQVFMPDSNLKGLLYFEDGGATPGEYSKGRQKINSRLRLVCWLNPEKFQAEVAEQLSLQAQSSILALLLPIKNRNTGALLGVNVQLKAIQPQDTSIFSRYTYNQAQSQYALLPYQYFAFDLECSFYISPTCSTVAVSDPCPAP